MLEKYNPSARLLNQRNKIREKEFQIYASLALIKTVSD